MNRMGFRTGEQVGLRTVHHGRRIVSEGWYVLPYDIPTGSIATYFPESNRLIPIESVADYSNTPTSKSVMVNVTSSSFLQGLDLFDHVLYRFLVVFILIHLQ